MVVWSKPKSIDRSPLGREVHEPGEGRTMPVGRTEGDGRALGALQVEVGRVLPGEPDAAVHLYALLRGPHGDRRAVRLRDGHRDRGVRITGGDAAGRVPGHRPRLRDG